MIINPETGEETEWVGDESNGFVKGIPPRNRRYFEPYPTTEKVEKVPKGYCFN